MFFETQKFWSISASEKNPAPRHERVYYKHSYVHLYTITYINMPTYAAQHIDWNQVWICTMRTRWVWKKTKEIKEQRKESVWKRRLKTN